VQLPANNQFELNAKIRCYGPAPVAFFLPTAIGSRMLCFETALDVILDINDAIQCHHPVHHRLAKFSSAELW
jgi:hypothetical protein